MILWRQYFVIKRVTMGDKGVQNCVTSFMDDPLVKNKRLFKSLLTPWAVWHNLFKYFQLSDTLTAILGGNTDKHGIVTLDWTTTRYSKRKERFNGKRWKSACAVGRSGTNRDELLVFIAGGLHKESKGMEVWNPVKVQFFLFLHFTTGVLCDLLTGVPPINSIP